METSLSEPLWLPARPALSLTASNRPLLSQIVVADTQAALERAGHAWREQFAIPVVGVAGSNGKTTAKEMTAAILEPDG